MPRTYRSRVDAWVVVMMLLPAIGGIGAMVAGLVTQRPGAVWMGAGALVFYGLLLALVVVPMRYTVGPHLRVRAGGIIRLTIPWDRLVTAQPSRDVRSSLALSRHRIEIIYVRSNGARATVLISPIDRRGFLSDLAHSSPLHRLEGDRVVAL